MATTKHMETTVDSEGKRREVEVFVFNNPAKRKRPSESEKKNPPQQPEWKLPQSHLGKMADLMKLTPETLTLDLDKARREVHSLGLSALEGRTKIEAQMAQLKRLGAKIPKNWERKMERKKRNQEIHRRRQDVKAGIKRKHIADPDKSAKRVEAEKQKKKEKKEGVFFDGQIGKYQHGVQYISSADIQSVRKQAGKGKR